MLSEIIIAILIPVIWVIASFAYMMLDTLNSSSSKILPKPLHTFMLFPMTVFSYLKNSTKARLK